MEIVSRSSATHQVDVAEQAVRTFGGDSLTRREVRVLLEYWKSSPSLSSREVEALLSRFPTGGGR